MTVVLPYKTRTSRKKSRENLNNQKSARINLTTTDRSLPFSKAKKSCEAAGHHACRGPA